MNKHYERDLEKLQSLLSDQVGRVRNNARIVLLMSGEGGALVPDDVLDREEVILEEECLKISALHQPVAHDLRYLTGVLKSNRDLERIGDLLQLINDLNIKVAEVQSTLNTDEIDFPALFGQTEVMVSMACSSLNEVDAESAKQVWADNKTVSQKCLQVAGILSTYMKGNQVNDLLLNSFLGMRVLERIAAHASSIAKNVLYIDTGEIVRHRRKEVLGDMAHPSDA